MKFTSFNPLIVTKDAEAAIKLFESLGFERRHNHTGIAGKEITNVTMKDATFIRIGTAGGMAEDVMSGDVAIGTAAIRMEGTSREYAPIEFPAVADFNVVSALVEAAKEDGTPWHAGVLQCKDSFYGQHNPDSMPVGYELKAKGDAFIACGALASEMESAALFTVGSVRGVRVGSIVQVLANQTRRAKGLEDHVTMDTEAAVRIGVEAMRKLMEADARE